MARVDKDNNLNGSPVFGVTKFSDWTAEGIWPCLKTVQFYKNFIILEFKVLLGRKSIPGSYPKRADNVRDPFNPSRWGSKNAVDITKVGVPDYINWATQGIVTPVKNQVL
jgi:hypothetical protein